MNGYRSTDMDAAAQDMTTTAQNMGAAARGPGRPSGNTAFSSSSGDQDANTTINSPADGQADNAVDQNQLLAYLEVLADTGLLRRLGTAFARFMYSLGMRAPAQIVGCAILSELEGRGHSCLMLGALADDPRTLLGWSADQWADLEVAAGMLPPNVAGWCRALAESDQVWTMDQKDRGQPLVLSEDRLYLRRYWTDEATVAQAVLARAAQHREIDSGLVHQWLDKLFDSAGAGTSTGTGTDPNVEGRGVDVRSKHRSALQLNLELPFAKPSPASSQKPVLAAKQTLTTKLDWQKIACAVSLRSGLSIITGGPGTGKTYTVARLLALLFAVSSAPEQLRIALAAPTGKAAARLKQSIDNALGDLAPKVGNALRLTELANRVGPARTLHSLLGVRPDTRFFRHHAGNPLDIDVLIVDEASMVHLEMMASLLAALPSSAQLILLGDKDQLASVEAGAVLGDLCRDAAAGAYNADLVNYVVKTTGEHIPSDYLGDGAALAQQTVMLRESRRFGGPIGALAHAINDGRADVAAACLRTAQDQKLTWIEHAKVADMLELAVNGRKLVANDGMTHANGYRGYLELLPSLFKSKNPETWEAEVRNVLLAFESFRILCAVRDGDWGVAGLNVAIAARLENESLIRRRGEWYVGRPVMVTRNDYGTGVFNGDIGVTLPDPLRNGVLRVYFLDGEAVRSVLASRLRSVETAYAMTVHKSQGSEFRHTILVLPPFSSPVITRELLYTGVTRTREYFTLVSPQPAILEEAINCRTQRASGLQSRIA